MNQPYTPPSGGSYDETQPFQPPVDPAAETQPTPVDPGAATRLTPVADPLAHYQPVPAGPPTQPRGKRPGRAARGACGCLLLPIMIVLGALLLYFFAPLRTNFLILGVDARPQEGNVGRTDTIILTTIVPLQPYVGMLSIPRDLWLPIPGHNENRINTAHFFAEAENPGSGPAATARVIEDNFKVHVNYYARINFEGFESVIDAMGGVTIDVPAGVAGFNPGPQHMDGKQALAFSRSRYGADDFYRMAQGQLLLKSLAKEIVSPAFWPRLPAVYDAVMAVTDTNIPAWQWPRMGLALVRAGSDGIHARTLTREEVRPFQTSGGAQVLEPMWDKIDPIMHEMFGR